MLVGLGQYVLAPVRLGVKMRAPLFLARVKTFCRTSVVERLTVAALTSEASLRPQRR